MDLTTEEIERIRVLSKPLVIKIFSCFSRDTANDVRCIRAKIDEFNRKNIGIARIDHELWVDEGLVSYSRKSGKRPQDRFNEAIKDSNFVTFTFYNIFGEGIMEEWELCRSLDSPITLLGIKQNAKSVYTADDIRTNILSSKNEMIDVVYNRPIKFANAIIDEVKKVLKEQQLEIQQILKVDHEFRFLTPEQRLILRSKCGRNLAIESKCSLQYTGFKINKRGISKPLIDINHKGMI